MILSSETDHPPVASPAAEPAVTTTGSGKRTVTAAPDPTLGQKAARGFGWMMLQTIGGKLVNMVSEVVLAWWIVKSDYGLRSDVFTVFMFANILQEAGINQVLIHRQASFKKWANAGFWSSIALGLGVGLVMAVIAPGVSRFYHAPALTGMILVLAVRSPINAMGTVSYARLQIELKYRQLAMIGFVVVCVTAACSVLCAGLGLGAYSFVWPLLAASVVRSALLWKAAPPVVRPRLQLTRWRYLIGQSGLSLAATALFMVTSQGDYTILGHVYSSDTGRAAVVGIYFFAYNLCIQTTQFITSNLANVLLPTFSKLQNEPARLKAGFLKATKLLALSGLLVCLLQAAVAEPMIQVLFRPRNDPDKWLPAVPVLQLISVAMALQLFNMPALALIQAQGRFRTMLGLSVLCAVSFMGLILIASLAGSGQLGQLRSPGAANLLARFFGTPINVAVVVAAAVVFYCAIIGPVCLWVAIRPIGGRIGDIWPIYVLPIVTSGVAVVAGACVGHLIPSTRPGFWAKLLVVPAVSAVVYLPLLRWTARDVWGDLMDRLGRILRRSRPAEPV